MTCHAYISGLAGLALTPAERAFFRAHPPWGFILFKRNIANRQQVIDLVGSLKEIGRGDRTPILIDQEGGRVQRLGPPIWPAYPPGEVFGRLYADASADGLRAAYLGARLIADDLHQLGINVDCLPLADVPVAGADAIIGDRAYGTDPQQVAAIARAVADGLIDGGVLPVLKHIPGHGRANADSHLALPVVGAGLAELERTDFAAFRPLHDLPMAMTAHVVFSALDARRPATISPAIMAEVIRKSLGFSGLVMSDDVSMNALQGTIAERTRAAFAAGCDIVLHCNGKIDEMNEVAAHAPVLAGLAQRRADGALARLMPPAPFDRDAGRAEFAALMAAAGWTSNNAGLV